MDRLQKNVGFSPRMSRELLEAIAAAAEATGVVVKDLDAIRAGTLMWIRADAAERISWLAAVRIHEFGSDVTLPPPSLELPPEVQQDVAELDQEANGAERAAAKRAGKRPKRTSALRPKGAGPRK